MQPRPNIKENPVIKMTGLTILRLPGQASNRVSRFSYARPRAGVYPGAHRYP
jgi:hypothetical protein